MQRRDDTIQRTLDQALGAGANLKLVQRRLVKLVQRRIESDDGLAFGRADGTPFATSTISKRANQAWREARLRPTTLHECRHTFASLMIVAGVNPKALQTFMGHASITVTLDRYGHLFPGSEEQAAVRLDAHRARH